MPDNYAIALQSVHPQSERAEHRPIHVTLPLARTPEVQKVFVELECPNCGSQAGHVTGDRWELYVQNSDDPHDREVVLVHPHSHCGWATGGWVETVVYACGSIAGLAVFVRNVVGTIKDWKDIRKPSEPPRKVSLLLGDREIVVNDGDDLEAVLRKEMERSPPKT